jgi:predicted nucleotidyltransferase
MDFQRSLSVVAPTLDGDVLGVLARADDEFTGRRIHRVLGHGSEHGVRRAANRLVEQGIVTRRQAGQANLYSLNRSHLAAPYVEGLGSLRGQLIERLKGAVAGWHRSPSIVFLFGSVARGEAGADSDLDLLVVRRSDVEGEDPEWEEQLAALERDATAWTGNEARVLEFAQQDLSDREVRGIVEEALQEGIPIFGTRLGLRKELARHRT